ncbi:MAG: hypothetical protein ACI8VE_001623 [Natrialbaceae archaeon]|jgi:hypothetical protein
MRRHMFSVVLLGVVLVLGGTWMLVAAPGSSVAADAETDPVCAGTIDRQPAGITVVSVQGYRFGEKGGYTGPRVIGYAPNGSVAWVHHMADRFEDAVWSYDVDPRRNGTLFVTASVNRASWDRGRTLLYELDARTGDVVWEKRLPFHDTHDADMLDDHRILIANMRNPDPENGTNDDRILIYNRTSDDVVWEWRLDDHYPSSAGGDYAEDWSHLNDVDRVEEGLYLASPRNFDQVILVNRTTGEIDLQLGRDDDYSILQEQHNPTYLESDDGNPTFLVADSENDRIVEYEHSDGEWDRTWRLGSAESFDWPRDADRLPNGNTLIADSRNNRAIEVTPGGEVVWEAFAPWLVYDVARVPLGDEPGGPTIADQGATGRKGISGDASRTTETLEACDRHLSSFETEWPADDGQENRTWNVGGNTPTVRDGTGTQTWKADGTTVDGRTPMDGATTVTGRPNGMITDATILIAIALAALLLLGVIVVRRR